MARSASRLLGPALGVACLAAWTLLANASPVRALATECDILVDGRSVSGASSPDTAIRVRSDQVVTISGTANEVIEDASLAIHVGPLPIPLEPVLVGRREWSDQVEVAQYATFGAGYYQVVGNIDQCNVSAWVFIESPSPLTTVASLIAFVALAVGAVAAGGGLLAGARRRGGLPRAVLGGVLVGGSALVLAQQTGVAPADSANMVTWTAVPGGAGGVGHALLGAFVAPRRASRRAGGDPRHEYDHDLGAGPAAPPTPELSTTYSPPPPAYGPPSGPPPPAYAPPAYAPPPYAPPPATSRAAAEPPRSAPPVPPTVGASRRATRGGAAPARDDAGAAGGAAAPVAEEEESGADAAAVQPDPPRESYAHLDCPEAVVAEAEFELVVGLASMPDREVVGGPLVRPDTSTGPYTMTIQVIADGFRLTRPHEGWRVDLRVSAAAPYPTTVLHLAAESESRRIVARTIRAMFSVDGQAIGLAARPIAVVRDAAQLGLAPAPLAATEPLDMALPTDQTPPDLTVRIDVSQPASRLLLQLLAPDPLVQLPSDPLVVDIGSEPGLFLKDIILKMNAAEGQPGMYLTLMGIGRTIAEQLPSEFWAVVADVAARVAGRPPTILFLSAEPYVPWELAVMEEPLDPALPPFLSAQASIGRWVLGQRLPKLPPPAALTMHAMAVVSGIYERPGWERLIDAEEEAAQLTERYGAHSVNAASPDVLRLVGGEPPADLLHFAVHGQYDPNGEIDGIVLVDGLTVDPMQIRGSRLDARPFVFLNACQVGSGHAVLGDYSGIAAAFLFAGASGVIAPLWSIDDVMAREIALRFYEQALAGRTPADILREERAAFRNDPQTVSSTYLAYQYFGHPHMTIARADD